MADISGGLLVGVDVGTNSARAGLFTREGQLVRHCSRQIVVWDENGCLEQSSDDIWSAVCFCVKVSSKALQSKLKSLVTCLHQSDFVHVYMCMVRGRHW